MRSRLWIVVLAAVALGGCGGEPTLSAGRADRLHAQVDAVGEAAAQGDRAAALERLDRLEASVRDLESGGSLAEADADVLRRGIGRARRRVRAEIAEPTPAPTATATATPVQTAPAEPAEPKDAEPGKGHEKAKDEGKAKGKKGGGG